MGADDEITQWILRLGHGDETAAQALWEQYFCKLIRVAERELRGMPRRAVDEEDVALSAMQSFCRGLADHRFQELKDREELWKLLVTITARKAAAQRRKHYALKRGGGKVRGDSVFDRGGADDASDAGLAEVLGEEPTPELACMVAENCRQLLERLGDDTLRQVAVLSLEGYTVAEIAEKLGCFLRTVERKRSTIRAIWSSEMPS